MEAVIVQWRGEEERARNGDDTPKPSPAKGIWAQPYRADLETVLRLLSCWHERRSWNIGTTHPQPLTVRVIGLYIRRPF